MIFSTLAHVANPCKSMTSSSISSNSVSVSVSGMNSLSTSAITTPIGDMTPKVDYEAELKKLNDSFMKWLLGCLKN
ncbi:hypothetical protein CYY_004371 [Polysphondylium violaceum]|uniref:Uncharacterized protein n=1 Tax=Polysphondylium violaceum TaxID=133409 RepID=A0A8J4UT23_9MYCE|nr:hypothetical protein CYY_004371 [Polysphondylium violaceum]